MAYIITVEEATRGLFAAWFMFLRDKRAAQLLENTYMAAVKSYWAALIVLPLYILGTSIEFLNPAGDDVRNFATLAAQAGLFNATVAEFCVFVLCWFVAWPLVLDRLAPYLDCDDNFFRYIVAYNWMRVAYVLVCLVYASLHFAGAVPAGATNVMAVAVLLLLWSYHWFVLRHALGVNGVMAALLVAAEFSFFTLLKATILAAAI